MTPKDPESDRLTWSGARAKMLQASRRDFIGPIQWIDAAADYICELPELPELPGRDVPTESERRTNDQ